MNPRLVRTVALIVGISVLVAGTAFTLLRHRSWESKAELAVIPASSAISDQANLLGNLQESGTMGTRVELISSKDTLQAAGSPNVQITARALPDTRVIDVTATGEPTDVRAGLADVITAAKAADARLDDAWTLKTITSPTAPAKAGPGTGLLLGATLLLAIIGGVATLIGLGRIEPTAYPRRREPDLGPDGIYGVEPLPPERVAERR
jgi:hypothetical protein